MADPFIAEIRIFPFNFAPRGWAFCNGQLISISQNTALFSLLGTIYGGNGQTTFALPNLQGAAPMHPGQGPGLSQHSIGETAGSATVTLLNAEMPSHTHSVNASAADATDQSPAGSTFATGIGVGTMAAPGPLVTINDRAVASAGSSSRTTT